MLRLKKDCAKTLHERYGCVFTERFTTRLYDEAFSSTVYVMSNVRLSSLVVHGWIEQAEATMTSYKQKINEKTPFSIAHALAKPSSLLLHVASTAKKFLLQ